MPSNKTLLGTVRAIPIHKETLWHAVVTALHEDFCDLWEGVLTATKLKVKRLSSPFQSVTATGGATTVDFENGYNTLLTLEANTTLTLDNPRDGERHLFRIYQDATGSRTITWPAAVKWSGGAPTLTTTGLALDLVCLHYSSTKLTYTAEHRLNFT